MFKFFSNAKRRFIIGTVILAAISTSACQAAPPTPVPWSLVKQTTPETVPTDTKSIDTKSIDTKETAPETVDTKVAAPKTLDTKQAKTTSDTKPVVPHPVDPKPADPKPIDAQPANTKPAATKLFDTTPAAAQVPAKSALEPKLRAVAARYPDLEIGIAVLDINSGEQAGIRADRSFPMASAFKLPILLETLRQVQENERGLTLDFPLTITNSTKCIGSGDMANLPDGSTVSLRQAIEKMITISDNTATDTILAQIGTRNVQRLLHDLNMTHSSVYLSNRQAWLLSLRRGVPAGESVRSFLEYWQGLSFKDKCDIADKVGTKFADTSLAELQAWEDESAESETFAQSSAMAAAVDNMGSPHDYNHLLSELWKGKVLSKTYTDYALGVLGRQQYNNRIPALLPKDTKVFHKTGTITGVVNDTGIMMVNGRPIAISVFIDSVGSNRTPDACRAIAELAQTSYNYFAR